MNTSLPLLLDNCSVEIGGYNVNLTAIGDRMYEAVVMLGAGDPEGDVQYSLSLLSIAGNNISTTASTGVTFCTFGIHFFGSAACVIRLS
jgi:hypothetical protein